MCVIFLPGRAGGRADVVCRPQIVQFTVLLAMGILRNSWLGVCRGEIHFGRKNHLDLKVGGILASEFLRIFIITIYEWKIMTICFLQSELKMEN